MSDPWHPEGIYQCNGCGRIYPEYVNGCVKDHEPPRKVALVTPDDCPYCDDTGLAGGTGPGSCGFCERSGPVDEETTRG